MIDFIKVATIVFLVMLAFFIFSAASVLLISWIGVWALFIIIPLFVACFHTLMEKMA